MSLRLICSRYDHSWVSAASASCTAEYKVIPFRLFPLGTQMGVHAVEASVDALHQCVLE